MSTQLFSTKYPNNIRTVTGPVTDGLYKDDSVILCNTSLGAVTINLDTIPASHWNTTAKIYISDISDNAAINNITIVAPFGFTINGASTLVINVNNGGAVVRILNNTAFQASLNYCCGSTAVSFIPILNSALLALQVSGTISVGSYYLVTDVLNADTGVVILGTTAKTVELQGGGLFLNPDYANVSGLNKGVWVSTLTGLVANVSIVIWNGAHYKNLTGAATSSSPDIDTTNWVIMSKSIANTYIPVCDSVRYDVVNNLVVCRTDVVNNSVEYYNDGKGNEAIALFQWGNNANVYRNKVASTSILNCLNNYSSVIANNLFASNILANLNAGAIQYNEIIGASELQAQTQTGNIVGNFISEASSVQLNSNTANVLQNTFVGQSLVSGTTNAANFIQNTVHTKADVTISGNTSAITYCTFGANLAFNLSTNTSAITSKRCESGFSNFETTLNLDNPNIFTLVSGTITISSLYAYVGIFNLYSTTQQAIRKIVNLPSNHVSSFYSVAGYSEAFAHASISTATANDIVCDAGVSTNYVIGRTNGTDFIKYQLSGNLNVRENLSIML